MNLFCILEARSYEYLRSTAEEPQDLKFLIFSMLMNLLPVAAAAEQNFANVQA